MAPWWPFTSKFHEDWAKNKTAPPTSGHGFPLITTIFKLAKKVTSRVKKTPPWWPCFFTDPNHFRTQLSYPEKTCFHYIHIEKTAPPPGGHVFPPIMTIFKLVRDIYKIDLIKSEIRREYQFVTWVWGGKGVKCGLKGFW
ncbi:hypothetical protein DPMN_023970 [Dreissena polymorpha]|uniref:Uncharacterized protein n=1 Tax=Dreissena polymorpha TaxID=45954 RepID=A0A9D4RB67_DREPO|nr:hypothetical protein DPMN_023970 [Dreissena polymorpha]